MPITPCKGCLSENSGNCTNIPLTGNNTAKLKTVLILTIKQTVSNTDNEDPRGNICPEDFRKPEASCGCAPYWAPYVNYACKPNFNQTVCPNDKLKVIEKTVKIFEGDKYYITYLNNQNFTTCKAIVQDIVCDAADPVSGYLNVMAYEENQTDCNCLPTKRVTIPVANIKDVEVITEDMNSSSNNAMKGVKIMVLGISATVVDSIIVNLEFINDNCHEAIKYVSLSTGKKYNISLK